MDSRCLLQAAALACLTAGVPRTKPELRNVLLEWEALLEEGTGLDPLREEIAKEKERQAKEDKARKSAGDALRRAEAAEARARKHWEHTKQALEAARKSLERFPPEAAERHRVHPARLGRAHAEIRVADPETMRQADRDGARHRRVGAGKGFQHTAHVVRPALEQRLHENREIGGQVDDVRIHAHDHLAARRLDADVQPARGDVPRVVEQADHGMVPGVLRDDVACAVAAHAVHHEQLHPVGGIVARENGLEATAQVPLLVAARHDHRDEGAGHGVPASAAWGQA